MKESERFTTPSIVISEFRRISSLVMQKGLSREFVKASSDSPEMAGFDGRLIEVKAR